MLKLQYIYLNNMQDVCLYVCMCVRPASSPVDDDTQMSVKMPDGCTILL